MDEIITAFKMNSRKIVVWSLILVVAIVGGVFGYRFYNEKNTKVLQSITAAESAVSGMASVRAQLGSTKNKIDDLDAEIADKKSLANKNDINKSQFFQFMSERATGLNLQMNRINSTGYTENYGVYTVGFDVEVQGLLENIIKIVNEIDSLGIGYNIKSMTLRDNSDYTWLKRSFDGESQVPWFVEGSKPSDASGNKIETMSDVEKLILQILESQKREEEAKKESIKVKPGSGSYDPTTGESYGGSSGSSGTEKTEEKVDNTAGTLQGRLEKILGKLPDSVIDGKVNNIETKNKDDIELIPTDEYTENNNSENTTETNNGTTETGNGSWVDTVTGNNKSNDELSAEDAALLETILKIVGNDKVDKAKYDEILEEVKKNDNIVIQDEVQKQYKLRIVIEFLTFTNPDSGTIIDFGDGEDTDYTEDETDTGEDETVAIDEEATVQ